MTHRTTVKCKVCNHRERAAIELALARRVSVKALERRYGLHHDCFYRHAKGHMPAQLRARLLAGPDMPTDLEALKATESQSLLANLVAIRHRLFGALDSAEEADDRLMLVRTVAALHQNLELTGKLLGDLGIGHTNVTNVLIMPQYVEMRVALVHCVSTPRLRGPLRRCCTPSRARRRPTSRRPTTAGGWRTAACRR
jgi:hypothetical protein